MARLDAHLNPEGPGWLLDVQADPLSHYRTRIVVPLIPRDLTTSPVRFLNPVLRTPHGDAVMLTERLFAVPSIILGVSQFSAAGDDNAIKCAPDMAFDGF